MKKHFYNLFFSFNSVADSVLPIDFLFGLFFLAWNCSLALLDWFSAIVKAGLSLLSAASGKGIMVLDLNILIITHVTEVFAIWNAKTILKRDRICYTIWRHHRMEAEKAIVVFVIQIHQFTFQVPLSQFPQVYSASPLDAIVWEE